MRQYLGVEVGVRRSAAQIGEQLPAHDRKDGRTGELVSKITSRFVAEGLVELAPGPRGGAGWSLTKKGKALIDRASVTSLSRTQHDPLWGPPTPLRQALAKLASQHPWKGAPERHRRNRRAVVVPDEKGLPRHVLVLHDPVRNEVPCSCDRLSDGRLEIIKVDPLQGLG